MKPTGIAPRITPKFEDPFVVRYRETTSKLWDYLRPDGRNAIIAAPRKVTPTVLVQSTHTYSKPTECIPSAALKSEGVGEIIDFRFG